MPTCTVKVFEDAGTVGALMDEHWMLMVHIETLCEYAAGGWAESASSTKGGGHSPQPLHCWRVYCHHDGHCASAQRKGWSLRNTTDIRPSPQQCVSRPVPVCVSAELAMFVCAVVSRASLLPDRWVCSRLAQQENVCRWGMGSVIDAIASKQL